MIPQTLHHVSSDNRDKESTGQYSDINKSEVLEIQEDDIDKVKKNSQMTERCLNGEFKQIWPPLSTGVTSPSLLYRQLPYLRALAVGCRVTDCPFTETESE